LDICKAHRKEKRALAFAFILYDLRNPQVAKALRDPDYWRALDDISGKYLTVFSIHTRSTEQNPYRQFNQSDRLDYMSWVTSERFEDGREVLERYFDLGNSVRLPAALFFQVANSEVMGSRLVQLREKRTEDTFLEIKDIIRCAANAVSEVTEENYGNDYEIFQLIEEKLRDREFDAKLSKIVGSAISLKGFLSLFGI